PFTYFCSCPLLPLDAGKVRLKLKKAGRGWSKAPRAPPRKGSAYPPPPPQRLSERGFLSPRGTSRAGKCRNNPGPTQGFGTKALNRLETSNPDAAGRPGSRRGESVGGLYQQGLPAGCRGNDQGANNADRAAIHPGRTVTLRGHRVPPDRERNPQSRRLGGVPRRRRRGAEFLVAGR